MSLRSRRPWGVAATLILLGAVLTLAERSAAERHPPTGRVGPCPSGTYRDEARGCRVVGLLSQTTRGRALRQQAARAHTLCFGPAHRSALVGRGEAVILDEALGDVANAARLGHLLSHATALAALPDFDSSAASCDAAVELARLAEERAHAIERELRRELGGPDVPVDAEDADPWRALELAYRAQCEGALAAKPTGRGARMAPSAPSRAPRGRHSRVTGP